MIDIRNYKEIIRQAIKAANQEDENYTWKVQAINKTEARFTWSYLNETEVFRLSVIEQIDAEDGESLDTYIRTEIPCIESAILVDIGESRWHGAATIEEGIERAIRGAAKHAMRVF